ncbi:MAG TPA: hypothetical protein PKD85_23190, partial [Saprospiraceae bacterium]|nr:hypothetical protein [Saprospiraceae bacterium]
FPFFARNETLLCVTNNSRTVNTNFIAIQRADLSITMLSPSNLTPFVGETYAIISTVVNAGNGSLDSFLYCIQDYPHATLSSLTINGMNIPLFSSTGGENCYLINKALLDNALGGMPFVNTSVQIIENWLFTSCGFPSPDIIRYARFGCFGNTSCIMSNERATGVIFGVAIPNVNVSIINATRPACFVETNPTVNARITNTGTAPLNQLVYTITAGNNSISNVQVRDANGNLIIDQMIDVTINIPMHCSGGTRAVRDTVRNINIPAGSFIDVAYELVHSCACTNGCSTNNIYFSSFGVNSFRDNCFINTVSTANASTADFDAYINGYVEGTQDLLNVGEVQYTSTSMELDWFNNSYPNAYIEQIIT